MKLQQNQSPPETQAIYILKQSMKLLHNQSPPETQAIYIQKQSGNNSIR